MIMVAIDVVAMRSIAVFVQWGSGMIIGSASRTIYLRGSQPPSKAMSAQDLVANLLILIGIVVAVTPRAPPSRWLRTDRLRQPTDCDSGLHLGPIHRHSSLRFFCAGLEFDMMRAARPAHLGGPALPQATKSRPSRHNAS